MQQIVNQPVNPEAMSAEEKRELLRQYPPKLRPAGAGGPVRMQASGEILIRSHDPNPQIGDLDEGDTTLPRGILNTGDPELLSIYRELYGDALRAMPDGAMYVEYLDQRIAGIRRLRQQKEESRKKTERGERPPLPPVKQLPGGEIRLTNVTQTEFQSSSQGCWSVSLSNILRSRGVQVSQKEIRAFRPARSFEEGNGLKALETNETNNDAGSDPFYDTELVMDNIPNTAVCHWGFQDLPPALIDEQGNVYRDITDDTAVAAIRKQVEYAIWHDQSPIALKYCGHYQTIIGIKGNKLILKDSLPPAAYDELGRPVPRDPDTTYEVDLYDVVRKTRSLPEGYQRDLSLMWLSELHKDPVTGKVEEMKDFPDLSVEENGNLSLNQAENANMITVVGQADTECGITAQAEVEGLRPFCRTKFPNVIRKDLLRNVSEPSRSVAEQLTIQQAAPSRETLNGTVVAKLPGYEEVFDANLYQTDDEEMNRAIQASLESHKAEQRRIEENIRNRQDNAAGRPSITQEKQGSPDVTQKDGPGSVKSQGQSLKLLNEKQREYLQNPQRLSELAALFETKKHARIANWNSGAYNDARSALESFRAEVVTFRRFVEEHYGKPYFDEGVEKQMEFLADKEAKLTAAMTAYVNKVTAGGTKGVEDMTQAAGAARLSGARGLLELVGGSAAHAVTDPAEKKNGAASDNRREERVRETSFERLYTAKYQQLKEGKEKNAHRRAASFAQDELKKQLNEAPKLPSVKK